MRNVTQHQLFIEAISADLENLMQEVQKAMATQSIGVNRNEDTGAFVIDRNKESTEAPAGSIMSSLPGVSYCLMRELHSLFVDLTAVPNRGRFSGVSAIVRKRT